jgi:hypothetical protein
MDTIDKILFTVAGLDFQRRQADPLQFADQHGEGGGMLGLLERNEARAY